jgi:hypothetical protein
MVSPGRAGLADDNAVAKSSGRCALPSLPRTPCGATKYSRPADCAAPSTAIAAVKQSSPTAQKRRVILDPL